jgi:hypothetical protein
MNAKLTSYAVSMLVFLSVVASYACGDSKSKYYAGAVLNNWEIVDFPRMETMGAEGVNYFRVCDSSVRIGESLSMHPGGLPQQLPADPVLTSEVRIQYDMLTLSLSYGGGCWDHLFALHSTGTLSMSQPPEVDLVLSHDAKGDPCKALISRNITFDLSSLLPSEQGQSTVRILLKFPGDTINHYFDWTPTPYFSCSYSYRSHSVGNAMVYLGYFAFGNQMAQPYPRIAVYFDTATVPTAGQKADAVAAELRWLAARNIVTGLSDVKIVRMQSALALNPQQYWTLQDTVLAYNMWFDGGTKGAYGTNGVRGSWGGCGLGVSYNLPSQPLGPVTAMAMPGKSGNTQPFRIINNRSQTILQLPYALEENAIVKVYTLNGALIRLIKGPSGSRAIEWDRRDVSGQRVKPGHYIIAWKGTSTDRCRLLVGP